VHRAVAHQAVSRGHQDGLQDTVPACQGPGGDTRLLAVEKSRAGTDGRAGGLAAQGGGSCQHGGIAPQPLVSDVTRIGEFSPETFEAQWLDGASGPRAGARFRGHVRRNGRGPVHWTTCTVTASDPRREFAFAVGGPGGTTVDTWRYQLEPAADGTDVTESFELPGTLPIRLYWSVAGRARLRTNLDGMRATLEKMKAVAERG
jgi:hypothetical protein